MEEASCGAGSTAHAVLVEPSDADAAIAPNVSAIALAEDDDVPLAIMEPVLQEIDQQTKRRPAIISVTVFKSKGDSGRGLAIEDTEDGLRIGSIDTDGVFHGTPLAVGDLILSVNNLSCEQNSAVRVSKLIQRSNPTLRLVVHRPDDDAFLMSTTVMKPDPSSRVGIGVQIYSGALRVSSIDPSGLFAGGILNVGDKVVSICGISCSCMDAASAIELIRKEPNAVTIVTWAEEEAGVVVAAAKTTPLFRYRTFLPCLFSVFLVFIIALIVMLSGRGDDTSSSDDKDGPRCKNLYGQPLPYC